MRRRIRAFVISFRAARGELGRGGLLAQGEGRLEVMSWWLLHPRRADDWRGWCRPWASSCAFAYLLGLGGFKAHAHKGQVLWYIWSAKTHGAGRRQEVTLQKAVAIRNGIALDERIRKWLARVISNLPQ